MLLSPTSGATTFKRRFLKRFWLPDAASSLPSSPSNNNRTQRTKASPKYRLEAKVLALACLTSLCPLQHLSSPQLHQAHHRKQLTTPIMNQNVVHLFSNLSLLESWLRTRTQVDQTFSWRASEENIQGYSNSIRTMRKPCRTTTSSNEKAELV